MTISIVEEVRLDKWLWSVRIFKTRNLATEACKKGKVKLNNIISKPSKTIKKGDLIHLNNEGIIKQYKVIELIDKRVSAKLVVDFVSDMTPESEIEKLKIKKEMQAYYRKKGDGKPSKKDRRELNDFTSFLE